MVPQKQSKLQQSVDPGYHKRSPAGNASAGVAPGWRQALMGTTARVESRVAEQRARFPGDWAQVPSPSVGGIRVWVVTRALAIESDHWVLIWRTEV